MQKKKILIIVILAVSLLMLLFINNNESNFEKHYIYTTNEKGLDLNSFYDANSLTFNVVEKNINNINCRYMQLNGLKNSKVENNINKSIKDKINQYTNDSKNIYSNISTEVTGNFANILSIIFTTTENEKEEIIDTMNYNLVNGNQLSITDLILSNVAIEDIMSKELTLVKEISDNYLNQFNEQQYKFHFTSFALYIHFNNLTLEIPYYKYPESFGLYYKYLTNVSIYKDDNVGIKDILLASQRKNGIYSILDSVDKNTYVDSVVFCSDDLNTKVIDGVKSVTDNLLDTLKTLDSSKYVFINQSGLVSRKLDTYIDSETNIEVNKNRYQIYDLTLSSNVYYLSEDIFSNNLKSKIYQMHRLISNTDTNVLTLKDYSINKRITNKLVILANGAELKDVTDLFTDGYDYQNVITEIVAKELEKNEDDVKILLSDCSYDYQLDTGNLETAYRITVSCNDNEKYYIPFDNFDKQVMNVY